MIVVGGKEWWSNAKSSAAVCLSTKFIFDIEQWKLRHRVYSLTCRHIWCLVPVSAWSLKRYAKVELIKIHFDISSWRKKIFEKIFSFVFTFQVIMLPIFKTRSHTVITNNIHLFTLWPTQFSQLFIFLSSYATGFSRLKKVKSFLREIVFCAFSHPRGVIIQLIYGGF